MHFDNNYLLLNVAFVLVAISPIRSMPIRPLCPSQQLIFVFKGGHRRAALHNNSTAITHLYVRVVSSIHPIPSNLFRSTFNMQCYCFSFSLSASVRVCVCRYCPTVKWLCNLSAKIFSIGWCLCAVGTLKYRLSN